MRVAPLTGRASLSLCCVDVQVHSPAELEAVVAANKDKLVVLMCKAKGCRPCKVRVRAAKAGGLLRSWLSFLNQAFREPDGVRWL